MASSPSLHVPEATFGPLVPERLHRVLVPAVLLLAACLQIAGLRGDSATVDEVAHLAAGVVHLRAGDLRLVPDHPPLAHALAALPVLFMNPALPDLDSAAFAEGDPLAVGRDFFYSKNDGEKLLGLARATTVALFLLLGLVVYAVSRGLFGPDAALVSLLLATFSPTLRAHGRLVTTDLPAALTMLLAVVAFERLSRRTTPGRLAAASVAVAAAVLTKGSWPLLLPALAVIAALALLRKTTTLGSLAACLTAIAVFTWLAVWACYGFRYSAFRAGAPGTMLVPRAAGQPPPKTQEEAWEMIFRDARGEPATGLVTAAVRFAREHRILPEASLYGVMLLKRNSVRETYFHGRILERGTRAYFPVAWAIKTPLPEMLLVALGLVTLVTGRVRGREPVLLAGLAALGAGYAAVAVAGDVDIGLRHILPVLAVVAVVGGAAAGLMSRPALKWGVPALVLWLVAASLLAFPHDLGYFNELVGGWRNGHRWLADSNLDWGQDMKRLARFAKAAGDPVVNLAVFGPADPAAYGLRAESLFSPFTDMKNAPLAAGTYVVSANQLLGLFFVPSRDAFLENPRNRSYYESLAARWGPRPGTMPDGLDAAGRLSFSNYRALAAGRLVNALARRTPDDRVGTSLFVFRLSQEEIDGFLRP